MASSTKDPPVDRSAQTCPVLTPSQVETARRFASGERRRFVPGEEVFSIGDRDAPAWLVLEGAIDISRRDGPDHEVGLTTHRARQFTGEISQLSGAPSLAAGHAASTDARRSPSTPPTYAR